MDSVPETPGQQTRTAVTRRIIAHVRRGWPRLGEPIVRHRGRFCYVSALLPGHREPTPILRLRYQGSADRWAIGIYLASSGQYTESELPASFGPKTGTPEEGVDDTFILYAGPKTGHLRPSARTRAQATKVRNTRGNADQSLIQEAALRQVHQFIALLSAHADEIERPDAVRADAQAVQDELSEEEPSRIRIENLFSKIAAGVAGVTTLANAINAVHTAVTSLFT